MIKTEKKKKIVLYRKLNLFKRVKKIKNTTV